MSIQRNFTTVGNEHRGQRSSSWCGCGVEARAISSHELAGEVSRLPESTHDHGTEGEEL